MKKLGINYKFGFTLIEMLIVISIIGVLSSMVISFTNDSRAKGRDAYRISQVREIKNALEMYYAINNEYPSNSFPLTFDENIPRNWASMVGVLNGTGLIHATFSLDDSTKLPRFTLAKTAYASMAIYVNCSIQDPLYKTGTDFQYSYGYVVSADRQSYKIRIYLETGNSALFQSSLGGTFLGAATTGNTACDQNFHYYCTGQ